MKVMIVLERFLAVPGREIDGRPLYAFRTSDDEYVAMADALREDCAGTRGLDGLPPGFDRVFCLYGAEWWRRNHTGGVWQWSGLLSDVGLEHLGHLDVYALVGPGLKYWHRPLLTNQAGRMWLITLACEGGLPLRLLHANAGTLRRYFAAVLERFDLYRAAGVLPSRLSQDAANELPASLRQPVVFELVGQLVDGIWTLRQGLGEAEDPVRILDERDPHWREQLPLALDDDTEKALLKNLVEDAARLGHRQVSMLALHRYLSGAGSVWRLQARIECPSQLDTEALRMARGSDDLPVRFEIHVTPSLGQAALLSIATRRESEGRDSYLLEQPRGAGYRVRDRDAARAATLELRRGAEHLGELDLRGGEALSELPWVFGETHGNSGQWRLAGEGATQSRRLTLLVAVRAGTSVDVEPGSTCESVGILDDLERTLFRVQGVCTFVDDEGFCCPVRSGAETDVSIEYRLHGARSSLQVAGIDRVFSGWPCVYRLEEGAPIQPVVTEGLQLRYVGKHDGWRAPAPTDFGLFDIRHAVDGVLEFRSRIAVLPEGFEVRFATSPELTRGELVLTKLGDGVVGWTPVHGLLLNLGVADADADVRVVCQAQEQPPASVQLNLAWPDGGELTLMVPFPCRGGRFIDAGGSALANHTSVSLNRLGQFRALALSTAAHDQFVLSGKLEAEDVDAGMARGGWVQAPLRHLTPGRFELELGTLREWMARLLASSSDLGAQLRFTIDSGTVGQTALIVRRFDFDLELDRDREEVWIAQRDRTQLTEGLVDQLHMRAFRLWAPEAPPLDLTPVRSEGVALGGWKFPATTLDAGPWLICGFIDATPLTRPVLWSVGNERVDEPSVDIEPIGAGIVDIVRMPDRRARRDTMAMRVAALALDPADSEWNALRQTFDAFRSLPPATIDAIVAVSECPAAAASMLMQASASDFDDLWDYLELLPFEWWSVPVDDWVAAMRRLQAYYERLLEPLGEGSGLQARRMVEDFIERSEGRAVFMSVVREAIRAAVLDGFSHQLALADEPSFALELDKMLESARQRLLQLHAADDVWPRAASMTAWRRAHWNSIAPSLQGLWIQATAGASYRTAVLNAPVVAALSSVCRLPLSHGLMLELRNLRAFDPQWFDEAYRVRLIQALGTWWLKQEQEHDP